MAIKVKKRTIITRLAHTFTEPSAIIEQMGLDCDEDAIVELMLDAGYQRCDYCGHWLATSLFTDDNSEPSEVCQVCREDDEP